MKKNIPPNTLKSENTNKGSEYTPAQAKNYAKLLADLAVDFQSLKWIKDNLYFILYMFFVGIIYIANSHFAERQTRKLEALTNEIKELKSEAMTLNAHLCNLKKQSYLSQRLQEKGIVPLKDIPYKLVIPAKQTTQNHEDR